MAMNLRENKIDKFDKKKKPGFFGLFGKENKKQSSVSKKTLSQNNIKKQAKSKKEEKTARTIKNNVVYSEGQQKPKKENWVRKEPKKPLPEEALDYQEDIKYEKEYSNYIEQNSENVLVHWRGPDFEYYPRSKSWYTGASLVIAGIVLYAVWTNSIIMAIVFVLIWLVGYLELSRTPKVIDFAVTLDGILVGDEIYDWKSIQSFWIFYEPPHTRIISLHMKGYLRPYLHIPLHQVDPVVVLEKLTEFIPEKEQEENVIDIVERLLHM